jgi:hypothetical protein
VGGEAGVYLLEVLPQGKRVALVYRHQALIFCCMQAAEKIEVVDVSTPLSIESWLHAHRGDVNVSSDIVPTVL